jgi:anti-sigma B factor antagonist
MPIEIELRELSPLSSLIILRGELLLGPASAQLAEMVPPVIASGRRNIVFDLSGLTHIDSTGIGRFIDTHGRLERLEGQMRLAGASGAVRDAFRVTRLDTVFPFYATVDAALAGLL